ncbi:uncharacterized protein LOC110324815 isoform X2 [Mus pahari]|uniref:uncharacterized protein LOC110324815 isoform X2 n=1 Tax=Mus pahari TaxID=10093 RepID=UPI0011148B5E|nr:uncharacterized protein LOC110324815 isoform X2 [Mus pahari]
MAHVSQPFSHRLLQPLCPGLSLRQVGAPKQQDVRETLTRLLEACLHSLLSFLTSNFPSNPLLPDSLFSIERLSLRFKTWLAGPGDPIAVFVELELLAVVLPWPVASSCAICRCTQVPRAAHLHRRAGEAAACLHASGIALRPCWLKKRRLRTPGRPARGPQEAQREDPRKLSARTPPTMPSARTSRTTRCNPSGLGQSHHLESCVGPWTHGHRHLPLGPSNCKLIGSALVSWGLQRAEEKMQAERPASQIGFKPP